MEILNKTAHPAKYYLSANIPIFKGLEEDALQWISSKLTLVEFIEGEEVYRKGEKEDYFHILVSGVVSLFPNLEEKSPTETFRRGDLIGLVSFLTGEIHSSYARATTNCKALKITRKVFEEICETYPFLGLKFSRIISNRIRNLKSRGKFGIQSRVIGIISQLEEPATNHILQKVFQTIRQESGLSLIELNISTSPDHKNLVLDENNSSEVLPFSINLEKYVSEYDLVFFKINKQQILGLKEIEKEFDKIFIICKNDKLEPEIQNLYDNSGFKSIYFKKFFHPSLSPSHLENRIQIFGREILEKRIGLALGGGAALGLAQIGVLRVLEKENIPIDMISGTSIGALIGGLWCSGKDSYEIEELTKEFDSVFKMIKIFDVTIPTKGLISGNKLLKFLEIHLKGNEFEALKTPFRAVACDITNREERVLKQGKVSMGIRMSTAIPGVFSPVLENDRQIVDGGIVNPLPVSVLEDEGIKRIIAINSMPSSQVTMKSNKENQGIIDIMINSLYSLQYRIGKYAANQADVYLNPILTNSSWYEFYRSPEFIELGMRETEKVLKDIKRLKL
jgi:NTE family protein